MASTSSLLVMAEAMAMEQFLAEKKIPGEDVNKKVDNYCKKYNVPDDVRSLMHTIRLNGNIARHSNTEKSMKPLEYTSANMKQYQRYYDVAKGRTETRSRTYIVGPTSAQKVKRNTKAGGNKSNNSKDNKDNSKPSTKSSKCYFYPYCLKSVEECAYFHPTKPCQDYPDCSKGDNCFFVHPPCRFGDACTKRPGCNFGHSLASGQQKDGKESKDSSKDSSRDSSKGGDSSKDSRDSSRDSRDRANKDSPSGDSRGNSSSSKQSGPGQKQGSSSDKPTPSPSKQPKGDREDNNRERDEATPSRSQKYSASSKSADSSTPEVNLYLRTRTPVEKDAVIARLSKFAPIKDLEVSSDGGKAIVACFATNDDPARFCERICDALPFLAGKSEVFVAEVTRSTVESFRKSNSSPGEPEKPSKGEKGEKGGNKNSNKDESSQKPNKRNNDNNNNKDSDKSDRGQERGGNNKEGNKNQGQGGRGGNNNQQKEQQQQQVQQAQPQMQQPSVVIIHTSGTDISGIQLPAGYGGGGSVIHIVSPPPPTHSGGNNGGYQGNGGSGNNNNNNNNNNNQKSGSKAPYGSSGGKPSKPNHGGNKK